LPERPGRCFAQKTPGVFSAEYPTPPTPGSTGILPVPPRPAPRRLAPHRLVACAAAEGHVSSSVQLASERPPHKPRRATSLLSARGPPPPALAASGCSLPVAGKLPSRPPAGGRPLATLPSTSLRTSVVSLLLVRARQNTGLSQRSTPPGARERPKAGCVTPAAFLPSPVRCEPGCKKACQGGGGGVAAIGLQGRRRRAVQSHTSLNGIQVGIGLTRGGGPGRMCGRWAEPRHLAAGPPS